ncbi:MULTISPECIES: LysR family transcriptional regulator [Pseudomonas]|jgi:DNA-binding transcriptional LysR family regulator|uniref:LysR family transcriptional regulator n=1 Tax=Pseudomonas TaxID=286 RepID=UPI000812A7F9|nr:MULTISPECIES: LysR family transcriptional regulator [Pseudomonas]CRM11605.1 Cyn operon transcriptional activator [Pseudomonas sp. 28 E 9]
MMNSQTELQDQRFKYLYLSSRLGTMRAAAEELELAVSSISRQIAKLESDLGIQLIQEGTHRICLTAAGQAAVDYYVERMGHHNQLLKKLGQLKEGYLNRTSIAVGEGLLSTQAIGELYQFFKANRQSHTELLIAPSHEVERMVAEDEADIGLVFSPTKTANINRLHSFDQPMRAIVHPDHPLAGRSILSLQDLADEDIVLPPLEYRIRGIIDQLQSESSAHFQPYITSNSLKIMLDLTRNGIASTILSDFPVIDELCNGTLKAIPIDYHALNVTQVQIISRQSRKLSPLSRDLVHYLAMAINAQIRRIRDCTSRNPNKIFLVRKNAIATAVD